MEKNMTTGSVTGTLVRFAIPFMLASLLQMLYGVVDLIVVGRFADAAAITAVNTSGQVMQIITSFLAGIASGGSVLIGQYIGARRENSLSSAAHSLFRVICEIAAGLLVLLLLTSPLLVRLLQVPEEAVVSARGYLYICAVGIPFIAVYNAVSGILRGAGDSRTPMIFVAVSTVLNIAGDLLLVGLFSLGAEGAAIATSAAQAIAAVSAVVYYLRTKGMEQIRRRPEQPERLSGKILDLGIPLAAQDALVSLSFVIITAVVNGMGVIPAAGVGIVERVISFCMLVPGGFLSGLSCFAAQNMGAGQTERATTGLKISIILCLGISSLFFLACQFAGSFLVGFFTTDTEIIAQGVLYLHSYAIDIFTVCFVFCLNGFFSGCGHTGFTMANGMIATFGIRVPFVLLVGSLPGITLFHIGLAAPAASLIQILIQLAYYRTGRWKRGILDAPQKQ